MAWPRTVVVRAHPRARKFCPPDLIEGKWMDAQGPPTFETFESDAKLVVFPTGRFEFSREGRPAEVWEIREWQ